MLCRDESRLSVGTHSRDESRHNMGCNPNIMIGGKRSYEWPRRVPHASVPSPDSTDSIGLNVVVLAALASDSADTAFGCMASHFAQVVPLTMALPSVALPSTALAPHRYCSYTWPVGSAPYSTGTAPQRHRSGIVEAMGASRASETPIVLTVLDMLDVLMLDMSRTLVALVAPYRAFPA